MPIDLAEVYRSKRKQIERVANPPDRQRTTSGESSGPVIMPIGRDSGVVRRGVTISEDIGTLRSEEEQATYRQLIADGSEGAIVAAASIWPGARADRKALEQAEEAFENWKAAKRTAKSSDRQIETLRATQARLADEIAKLQNEHDENERRLATLARGDQQIDHSRKHLVGLVATNAIVTKLMIDPCRAAGVEGL